MRYPTVLLDLDHTLVDSDASEVAAFEATLASAGVEDPAAHYALYTEINRPLWAAVERGEITPNEVRVTRFERLAASIGITADPKTMADAFVAGLGAHGELYPGVRSVLEQLAEVARLALVTNGIGDVQRARIERLDLAQYADAIVISGEVGVAKPGVAIFDIVFARLDSPSKQDVLMVGDSLSSDIQGGVNYGIDTCWYNRQRVTTQPSVPVTHTIHDIAELPQIVAHGA